VVVIPAYTYEVEEELYTGHESFLFIRDEDAAQFESAHRRGSMLVRYRPDKPKVSILSSESVAA
jgi:hypothetical protein